MIDRGDDHAAADTAETLLGPEPSQGLVRVVDESGEDYLHPDPRAVFVVEPEVELRESVGSNGRELSRVEDPIDDQLELVKQKWAEHLG